MKTNIKLIDIYRFFVKNNIFIYILLFLFILLPIFFKDGQIFLTDYVFGSKISLDKIQLPVILLKFLSLFLSINILSKVFFSCAILLLFYASYKVCKFFAYSRLISLVTPLFIIFSSFLYERMFTGYVFFIFAFAFSILSFYLLIKNIFEKINYKYILLSILFFAISSSFSLNFIFLNGLLFVFCFVFIFIKHHKEWVKLIILFLLSFVFVFVFNIDTIFNLTSKVGNYNKTYEYINNIGVEEFAEYSNSINYHLDFNLFYNLFNSSNFLGDFLKSRLEPIPNYPSILSISSFSLVFILFIYGIYKSIKDESKNLILLDNNQGNKRNVLLYKIFFILLVFIFILSLILQTGLKIPILKDFNLFLFENIPFYKGMRDVQKWGSVTNIIYLIFISIGFKYLLSKIDSIKFNRKKLLKICASSILAIVIILRAPFVLFGFWGQIDVAKYPDDWYQLNTYLRDDKKCDGKILFLPFKNYLNFSFIDKKYIRKYYNFAEYFFDCNVIVYKENMDSKNYLEAYNKWIESHDFDYIRNDIKYIILGKYDDYENYSWIFDLKYLQKIRETKDFYLFEVKN